MTRKRRRGEVPKVGDQGRQDGEKYAKVGNQAKESADDARENRNTASPIRPNRAMLHALRKTPMMKLPTIKDRIMRATKPEHDVGGITVLHVEQHDRSRAHVVLPAQHEEDQKRNKGERKHNLRDRAGVAADQVGPTARLLHGDGFLVLLRRWQEQSPSSARSARPARGHAPSFAGFWLCTWATECTKSMARL